MPVFVRPRWPIPVPVTDFNPTSGAPTNNTSFIVIISIFALILSVCLLISSWLAIRRIRRRNVSPRYIPTKYLKDRWIAWTPSPTSRYKQTSTTDENADGHDFAESLRPLSTTSSRQVSHDPERDNQGIDRQTSLRSVLTLPAYHPTPSSSEQVLGREGERGDGIDVVVSFPDTAAEEEVRRDEEMEALYQVRLTRRAEAEAREERRQRRREAHERADWRALEEMRQESQIRAVRAREEAAAALSNGRAPTASDPSLPLPHPPAAASRTGSRERRVSSVSYGELGVAHLDGTRIRSASASSDRHPLLAGAASVGGDSPTPRERSRTNSLLGDPVRPLLSAHHRHGSTGSGLSVSTNASELREHDGETEPFPGLPPPEYEEQLQLRDAQTTQEIRARGAAPSYEAVSAVPPRLGSLRVAPLPAITISLGSEPNTPVVG